MAGERAGARDTYAPRIVVALITSALAGVLACGSGSSGGGEAVPAPLPQENPGFRAIAGVSMGAYGALNVGTKHPDVFGTIAALGGPVDLTQLLTDTVEEGLEVKPQTVIPRTIGDDFTFDHLPPYPGRDTQVRLLRDLVIAFGNPFLHHPDPARQFFAIDSEPAMLLRDDVFGTFTVPGEVRGFFDGGDGNEDGLRQSDEPADLPTDVLLVANGSLGAIAGVEPTAIVGGRALADLDGDGVYDVGDGIVLNPSEPIRGDDGDLVLEPELGEEFDDFGLDGVPGTGDFGEGNGVFDVDPDRATWLEENPTTRLAGRSASDIARQRIYMDVGTEDEFEFGQHYTNLVEVLRAKGLQVRVQDGYEGDCFDVPKPSEPLYLLRYPGGHIGIPESDSVLDDLLNGEVCGAIGIWQRLVSLIGYLDASFPDGNYGVGEIDIDIDFDDFDFDFGDLDVRGEMVERDVPAPSLQLRPEDAVPTQRVLVYRPPEFERSDGAFPIVYVLGGYGQTPQDFERAGDLLDFLILTRQVQNMFVAFLPGSGGQQGSFYVNHRVAEDGIPDVIGPTSGRYEDVILFDLIPAIENDVARGRIRR
ncbi:MAG TPA: alpha/beta hydrolase-fold protein [Candidatus Binatia bacterium]